MEDRKELYINGMTNIDDVINMIKDNIDRGDIEDAKDYLDQLNDYIKAEKEKEIYFYGSQVELDIERDLQRWQKELQMGFEGCGSCVGSDTFDQGVHLL